MIRSISQSMLNMASRCGEQFRRRYLEGEILPPAVAAVRGTAVHRAASQNHIALRDTGERMNRSDIVDAAATAYMEVLADGVSLTREESHDKNATLGKGKDEAVSLAGLYADKVSPLIDKPILVEEMLQADIGLDLPMSGTIDLLHCEKKILDLKTSSMRKPLTYGVNNLQAMNYALLVEKNRDIKPEVEFTFLVANKTPVEQTIASVRCETDELVLKSRGAMLIRMINSGIFPPANPGEWSCSENWCGYWSSCPYVSNPVQITI